jgi:hypothetical protein
MYLTQKRGYFSKRKDEKRTEYKNNRNFILKYIQQDTTLHSSLYMETALYILGGTITYNQERK